MNISLPDELKPCVDSRITAEGFGSSGYMRTLIRRDRDREHFRQYRIQTCPGDGSPRYAHESGIPQLRYWMSHGLPDALPYIEHHDHPDVIRFPRMGRTSPKACGVDEP